MPRTAADLVNKFGKHAHADDAQADGLFWRRGKWGATNASGDLVDASGAFFDLSAGSTVHIHIYAERDHDMTIGHVKTAAGKKMQFKNEAGCKSQMKAAGFSAEQEGFVCRTLFPEFHKAPKLVKVEIAPAPPTVEEMQEAGRLAYHAKNTKLRQNPLYAKYEAYYDDAPYDEEDLIAFNEAIKAGDIDLDAIDDPDATTSTTDA